MVGFKWTIIFIYVYVGCSKAYNIHLNLSDIFLSENYVGKMLFNKLQSITNFPHLIQTFKKLKPQGYILPMGYAILFMETIVLWKQCSVPLKCERKDR